MWLMFVIFTFATVKKSLAGEDYVINNRKFLSNFTFGAASSAYQSEGAWNEDGREVSIWDHFTHKIPNSTPDGSNGDITCDAYHKYKEDIAILKSLGVDHYRISISWTRILKEGRISGIPDEINEKGIQHYKDIIQELKINNITPIVTLYHYDLPQVLQDKGGFLNESFPKWFATYSRIIFNNFGDEVSYWITFNQPEYICIGYGDGIIPPSIVMPGVGDYLCMHNLLKAHAAAYHISKDELLQNGSIGIAHYINYTMPLTNSSEDISASEQAMQFRLGWVANPIYYGDYPEIMKTQIAKRSAAEGLAKSRLPEFTEEEKHFLRNTSDYFALNIYETCYAFAIDEPKVGGPPSFFKDSGIGVVRAGGDATSGITDLIRWVTFHYDKPDIIITENGLDTSSRTLEDDDRISKMRVSMASTVSWGPSYSFLGSAFKNTQNSLSRVKDALDEGINILGYSVWSIMDNFEWTDGFLVRYGIYDVDFDSPNRTRTPRKSAKWYKELIKTRCLVDKCIE